ncbi:hypothetical protein SLA2020_273990 [Shorea laevis]
MEWPSVVQITPVFQIPASSTALARHSDGGGIPKPLKSLLRRGFLNSLPSVALGSSTVASSLAPSPPGSTVRVPGAVLNIGLALGGLPRRRIPGFCD